MKQLETLLNSLIQRGWKPWGEEARKVMVRSSEIFVYNSEGFADLNGKHIRELVSPESGLWQFVCDKELYSHQYRGEFKFTLDGVIFDYYQSSYKFWLLESSLVPKEELGKFLVENIKTE